MKTIRLIAAVVLLVCAGAAAYFSYSRSFASLPPHATSGGPPAGISMPRKPTMSAGEGKVGKEPRGSRRESAGQAGTADSEKGGSQERN